MPMTRQFDEVLMFWYDDTAIPTPNTYGSGGSAPAGWNDEVENFCTTLCSNAAIAPSLVVPRGSLMLQ